VRVCPECDRQGSDEICPACGTRTLLESPSDPGIDPLLGRVLEGRYRLESLIGRGGMGAVYKATQITMNKVVAVKVVKPEFAANTEAAKRFHREAKAASSLSHPHTIRVFDFGQTPQRELYMAMEFLDGRSLGKALLEGERLPLQRTLKIVSEIASSLVEAHESGLVHRDLKPENVILLNLANDPDFVKVLDFGIAKFLSGSSGDSTVTRTGAVIGTPQYMAPEQARASRSLSTAADVYSLGVILYEMLTGDLPFEGDSPIDMLMAHVNEPVPDLPADLEVPDDVRALVGRMLAKQPDERPGAAHVASELDEIREREKALSFMARRGARDSLVVNAQPLPSVSVARVDAEHHAVETAVVDVGLAVSGEPDESSDAESVEFALLAKRRSNPVLLAVGIVLLVSAAGLLAWHYMTGTPESSAETRPQQTNVEAPQAADSRGPALATPVPTDEVLAPAVIPSSPAEVGHVPADSPPKPAEVAPAPSIARPLTATGSPTPAVATPNGTEVAPAPTRTVPPARPADVKVAPAVMTPKPAAARPGQAIARPKAVEPKPAATKPTAPARAEDSDDRTPAVW